MESNAEKNNDSKKILPVLDGPARSLDDMFGGIPEYEEAKKKHYNIEEKPLQNKKNE